MFVSVAHQLRVILEVGGLLERAAVGIFIVECAVRPPSSRSAATAEEANATTRFHRDEEALNCCCIKSLCKTMIGTQMV